MPGGAVHLKLWYRNYIKAGIVAVIIEGSFFKYGIDHGLWWAVLSGLLVVLGYLLGYYIDPDYDQANTTSGEWRLMRDFGFVGALLVGWFTPYGLVFKHRSMTTHAPFYSTLIRMLWLCTFPPFAIAIYLIYRYVYAQVWVLLLFVWFGLSLADSVHFMADWGIIRSR